MKLHFSYRDSVYQKQQTAFCFEFRYQLHPFRYQLLFYHQKVPACFRLASEPLILPEVCAAPKWDAETAQLGGVSADSFSFTRTWLRLAASDLSRFLAPQQLYSLTLSSKKTPKEGGQLGDGFRLFLAYLSTLLHSFVSSPHYFSYK